MRVERVDALCPHRKCHGDLHALCPEHKSQIPFGAVRRFCTPVATAMLDPRLFFRHKTEERPAHELQEVPMSRSQDDRVEAAARLLVTDVARALGEQLTLLSSTLGVELAEAIPELRGEPAILDLLRASIQANIETFLHLAQHEIAMDQVSPPAAAVAYAQRLAQRGISSTALVRAYRLGQRRMVDVFFTELAAAAEPEIAYVAARILHDQVSRYVDMASEGVVGEYEAERERWLANRNSVRASMVTSLLRGDDVAPPAAESALGYRLRQHHLGVVAWDPDRDSSTSALRRIESVVAKIAEVIGAAGQPLFLPQDRSLGWAWIPLGRASVEIDIAGLSRVAQALDPGVRVALGSPGAAATGFRSSHVEALRAYAVATIAAERAAPITSYADPGVRATALLTADLAAARELVAQVLGGLAVDDEPTQRLRETLLVFLSEAGSFRAAGQRLHVHRNTVKYRIDRAVVVRGRGLDDDRFNLELALLACQWLGRAVLS